MRYLPHDEADRRAMLGAMGAGHIDELFADVPEEALLKAPVDLPAHQSELAVERHMKALSGANHAAGDGPFFIGAGAYRHHVPASVAQLATRGEFLTAYTPYQPEISQGTLHYLFEFQTQVALLTGMEVANASLYDGSTACSEAILMARRVTRRKKAILSGNLHPHYIAVAQTNTRFTDDVLVCAEASSVRPEDLATLIDEDTSCVVVQNPDFFGHIQDLSPLAEAAHAQGALLIVVVTEPVSLGAIKSPGEMGADIVCGEGQGIGNALNFGGPYLGLFAAREKFVRQMPGRLCGKTRDADGREGYVLTLSTREQHIRREKATSNICTNSGLCALSFSIHMSLLGEAGLRQLAQVNHARAVQLAERLVEMEGVELLNSSFFNEFTVRLSKPAAPVVEALASQGILAGLPVSRLLSGHEDLLLLAATETCTDDDIDALAQALAGEVA